MAIEQNQQGLSGSYFEVTPQEEPEHDHTAPQRAFRVLQVARRQHGYCEDTGRVCR